MAAPKKYGNIRETAEALGVSRQAIQGYIQRGELSLSVKSAKKRGGKRIKRRINIEKAREELARNLSDINRGRKGKKPGEKLKDGIGVGTVPAEEKQRVAEKAGMQGIDLAKARLFNEQYKAALKKLEYEQKSGKLINVDEVEARGFEAGRMIKEQCLSIADRCSPLVAVESDQFKCKQILVKEISRILEGLNEALSVRRNA